MMEFWSEFLHSSLVVPCTPGDLTFSIGGLAPRLHRLRRRRYYPDLTAGSIGPRCNPQKQREETGKKWR